MKNSLIQLFSRDLDRLEKEISSYKSDTVLWKIEKNINNSAGNLAIHILGNLNHFIGATLGNSGYVRDREGEFIGKNISRQSISTQTDEVKKIIESVISSLTDKDLNKIYPLNVFKKEMTTEYFLIHLYGHLNYHLGQINYHRRLLD